MILRQHHLSVNKKRNKVYIFFLGSFLKTNVTVNDIIHMGHRLMRKQKLHPHFFGNNSLLETAQYLTFFSLGLPYEYTNPKYLNLKITEEDAEKIISLFEKRISKRMPVEYITHEAWYSGNRFYVNENVLVPRSLMSTRFNDFLNEIQWENYHILDLCAGSGCVGITLALLNSKIKVDLADISSKALEVANANIDNYSLKNRVRCIQSNLFENIHNKYDLIITNPPYVSTSEYKASPDEFKNEPKIALESGPDGLEILNTILVQAKNYLNPNGTLIAEVGFSAAKRLKKRYTNVLFKWFTYKKPIEKKSLLDIFAMHCIFLCEAKGLP